jgi:hypothetical protein
MTGGVLEEKGEEKFLGAAREYFEFLRSQVIHELGINP